MKQSELLKLRLLLGHASWKDKAATEFNVDGINFEAFGSGSDYRWKVTFSDVPIEPIESECSFRSVVEAKIDALRNIEAQCSCKQIGDDQEQR